jgi:hypothetical protein
VANTTTNETADLIATIGSLTGQGVRIATATGDSTIAGLRRTDVDGSLLRIGNQEADSYKIHCGDDALARRAGV